MKLTFYKTPSNRWYIDYPSYMGPKEDLEMVAGADTLLHFISGYGDNVDLEVELQEFDNCETLNISKNYETSADYIHKETGLEIWLCQVTFVVLGCIPNNIYFKVL